MANCLMFVLNFIALVVSVPIILQARSLYHDPGHTTCDRYLAPDLMSLGVFLLIVSLMWLIGSCCRMRFLLWLHLFVIFGSVIGIMISSMSGLFAIRRGEGQITPQQGIDDGYRVENFSPWMQKNVRDQEMWLGYRTCLIDQGYCKDPLPLQMDSVLTEEQYMNFFPAEWGCCKPPKHCGYEKENATFWTVPKTGLPPSKDRDCLMYSNHQDTMCFDCETCKAGFLVELRHDFKKMFILNTGICVFLLLVSWTSCSNLRNSKHTGQYSAGYNTQMA